MKKQLELKQELNQVFNEKSKNIKKYFYELIETKVAQYTNELNYNLEQNQKKVEYMKGDELLKQQTIQKDILNIFRDLQRDNQLKIKNTDSKFTDYRLGIKFDITKFIEKVKINQDKFIKSCIQNK